ncbi:MAG: Sua5/YciO/YrdC/YwlC family protein, partial [Kiloniellales bacterium]
MEGDRSDTGRSEGQRQPDGDAPVAAVEAVAAALRAGRLVILPTETVYGLAADAADPAAV